MKRLPTSPNRPVAVSPLLGGGIAVALTCLAGTVAADGIWVDSQVIVRPAPGHTIEEINQTWGTTTVDAYLPGNLYLLYYDGSIYLDDLDSLMTLDPAVSEAEVNCYEETPEGVRQMVISGTGGGYSEYADQTIVHRLGISSAHQAADGSGVLVAVLDSGVQFDHPALAGKLSPLGYDFVGNDSDPSDTADGVDNDGDGLTDEGHGHGTMVAGIVALAAPGATILPIRVLNDEGRGNAYRIAKAIHYAQSMGAQVVNMSFGATRRLSIVGGLIADADSAGVLFVGAAGNESSSGPPYFPGEHSKVLMVTGVAHDDVKASFADYNSAVDVSSPGVGVRSAFPGDGWAIGDGCSFATPFVAGEAALLLDETPGLSPAALRTIVGNGVVPIDDIPGNLPYQGDLGTGRVYFPFALGMTTGSPEGVPRPVPGVYPNPARGPVSILTGVATPGGGGSVEVLDVRGGLVRTLAAPPSAEIRWDGRDAGGLPVPAGVYFIRVAGRPSGAARLIVLE